MNGGEHEISSGNSELAFFIAKYDNNANLFGKNRRETAPGQEILFP